MEITTQDPGDGEFPIELTPEGIVEVYRKIGKIPCRDRFYDMDMYMMDDYSVRAVVKRSARVCGLMAACLSADKYPSPEYFFIGDALGIGNIAARSYSMGWDDRLEFYEHYMRSDPKARRWAMLGKAAAEAAFAAMSLSSMDPVASV